MENRTTISSATPESFWTAINALTEKFAETERLIKKSSTETEKRRKEADARHKQAQAEFERDMESPHRRIGRINQETGRNRPSNKIQGQGCALPLYSKI